MDEIKLDAETIRRLEGGEVLQMKNGRVYISPPEKSVKLYVENRMYTLTELVRVAEALHELGLTVMYAIGDLTTPVNIRAGELETKLQTLKTQYARAKKV